MPAISASAPAKTILFGEHAVVYSQPAIAVPITKLKATTFILALPNGRPGDVLVDAPDIKLHSFLDMLPEKHPFSILLVGLLNHFKLNHFPSFHLKIKSDIPIASGLGSGTAVSVSILRAVSTFLGQPLSSEEISKQAFEVEKIYHGNPSGIDNTVITYAQPVYFVKNQPIRIMELVKPLTLVLGDTGKRSVTSRAVGEVRQSWQEKKDVYERIFGEIGVISHKALGAIHSGKIEDLGPLMLSNHALLRELNVSSPELDHLVDTAILAGAFGAKLSGAGLGGYMVALVNPAKAQQISDALLSAGAAHTIITQIEANKIQPHRF
jgi:mevalonate kinase